MNCSHQWRILRGGRQCTVCGAQQAWAIRHHPLPVLLELWQGPFPCQRTYEALAAAATEIANLRDAVAALELAVPPTENLVSDGRFDTGRPLRI